MRGALTEISRHVHYHSSILAEVRGDVSSVKTRSEDHTQRIQLVEAKHSRLALEHGKTEQQQTVFQARSAGIYIGISALITLVATGLAIWKSF